MTENPQHKEDAPEKISDEQEIPEENGAWRDDQKRRGYYYDDACGYEIFDPAAEDDEEK